MHRALIIAALAWAAVVPTAHAAATVQPGDPMDFSNCTLAWVFDGLNPDGTPNGQVFFSTAAHCVEDHDVVMFGDGAIGGPFAQQDQEVLGTVRARGDSLNIETDVALIQVADSVKARVRPEMRGHPDIPSGIARTAAAGAVLQFSGWGLATAAHEATRQQRVGVLAALFSEGHGWEGAGPLNPGDSGSPVALAGTGEALGLFKGLQSGDCGPTIASVETLAASVGLRLRLRLAGESRPSGVRG